MQRPVIKFAINQHYKHTQKRQPTHTNSHEDPLKEDQLTNGREARRQLHWWKP